MSLTLDRIFGDPDLNGPTPLQLKLSPDGQHVSYLKAPAGNFEQLDLWSYNIARGEHSMLVDSAELATDRVLSDAEKARRERLRISHAGIVEYYWSPKSDAILFPIEGNLFLYTLNAAEPLNQLTDSATFETDIRFSPNGEHIAFVRDQNLFTLNLSSNELSQLTVEGGGLISCGLAEFIAQEEMHRFEGYWWSPDSQKIAFTKVDESPVEVSQRYEIDADNFGVFDQRYPFAGKTNASVQVGIVNATSKNINWIALSDTPERYITRINWFRDSQTLAIQLQSRDQQLMTLERVDISDNSIHVLVTETSDSWINLNDNFTALADNSFLWGSERTGFNQIYHFDFNGELIRRVTTGDWVVCDIKAVTDGALYLDGFKDTPLEKHLYRVAFSNANTLEPKTQRITQAGFTHQTSMSRDASVFVDRLSSAESPLAVSLMDAAGNLIENLEPNTLNNEHPFFPFVHDRGQHRFEQITADDNQTLHYRVIQPSSNRLEINGKSPLILTVYGGPGVQRVSNEWIPTWHHYMASQGYGLLQLDNRGTANRGKAFESPIFGELGKVEVDDQLKGLKHVLDDGVFDPSRVAVFGHSYGGYMTLMLMMKSQMFRAGISVAPVTDWALYDTHYTERYLGLPEDNSKGYERSAVFPYVESLSGKLLVIHGMADDNVLFSNSTKLYKALQDHNIDFDIMNYPGAKHGLTGRTVNLHRYSLMDRFLSQNLKGTNS